MIWENDSEWVLKYSVVGVEGNHNPGEHRWSDYWNKTNNELQTNKLTNIKYNTKWTDTWKSGKANMYMYWEHTNKKQTNNKSHSNDGNINFNNLQNQPLNYELICVRAQDTCLWKELIDGAPNTSHFPWSPL